MSDSAKSNLLLAVMICWYVFLGVGSGFFLLFGPAFGLINPSSYAGLLMLAGPLVLTFGLLFMTGIFWKKNKRITAISLWLLSLILVFASVPLIGVLNT